jgi:hypothetical protein
MPTSKPLALVVRVLSAAAAAYIIVTALEGYHPKSPTCLDTALQRGVESMPSYCKLPVWNFVLAVLILLIGSRIARQLGKPPA